MTEKDAVAWGDRFEMAVSFAGTLASMLNRRNVFYAFAAHCPDLVSLPYDQGRGHFIALMEALATAEPAPDRS